MNRWLTLWAAGLALACAAACAPSQEVAGERAAIIDGEPADDQPGVVAVVRSFGDQVFPFCSGTVIGPYAVLTAKHCIDGLDPTSLAIGKGQDVTGGIIRDPVPVLEIRTTPGPFEDGDLYDGSDVAVLLLARDVGAPAHAIGSAPPALDDPITIVGYGRTDPGVAVLTDYGRKHMGTAWVDWAGEVVFTTLGGSASCHGDSGGAALDASDRVVGVTSFGTDSRCESSVSGFAEVSQHTAMITEALTFVPPCIPEDEVCNDIDDDCNGIVDDGCTATGEACDVAEECESGRCEDVGGVSLCTGECDPTTREPCAAGLGCEADGCGTGRCVPAGTAAAGEECETHADCASARCVSLAGVSRCGEGCVDEGPDCPGTLVCEAPDGACGTCVPEPLAVSPRLFGDPCDDDARCASGRCTDGWCSRACDDASPCPRGYHCRDSVCVEGDLGEAGAPCVNDDDCAESAPTCGGEPDTYCAAACNDLGNCPEGFECAADLCLPEGAALGETCEVSSDCRSSRCEAGLCSRPCDAAEACPTSFDCVGADAGERTCVPRPADSGGCNAAGGPGGSPLWPLAPIFAVLCRHRRQRAALRAEAAVAVTEETVVPTWLSEPHASGTACYRSLQGGAPCRTMTASPRPPTPECRCRVTNTR